MHKKVLITLGLEIYDRRIHEGALRYAAKSKMRINLQQPFVMPWGPFWKVWFPSGPWQGLILMVKMSENLPLLRQPLRAMRRPFVLLCAEGFTFRCQQVREDNYAVGRLAAEYLLGRQFRRFAVVAQNMDAGYAERLRGFQETLSHHNVTLRRIILQEARLHTPRVAWREFLMKNLREAEKPLAVFALDDLVGQSVLFYCDEEKILVPEEVAVLGVGNDPTICNYTESPLSSVDTNGERIGWAAAELLHGMILGKAPTDEPVIIAPLGVVERRSTEIVASNDLFAMRVLRSVWDELHEPVKPAHIARSFGLTRWNLDRLFVSAFGCTVKKEQTRLRMLRIKELLATTDMNAKEIAEAVGFRTLPHMCRIFLREEKMTMKQYCRQRGTPTIAPWQKLPEERGRRQNSTPPYLTADFEP